MKKALFIFLTTAGLWAATTDSGIKVGNVFATTGTNAALTGNLTANAATATNGVGGASASLIKFPADGRLTVTKADGTTAATRIALGGEQSTNAALKHVPGSNPQLQVRTGDDANYADLYASNVVASAAVSAASVTASGAITAGAGNLLAWTGRSRMAAQEATGASFTLQDVAGSVDRIRLDGTAVTLTDAVATEVFRIALATNSVLGCKVHYTILVRDAAYELQNESGEVEINALNVDGAVKYSITEHDSSQPGSMTGTLTTAWTAAETAANVLYVYLNADTSLTPVAMSVITEIQNSYGAITMQ